MSMGQKEVIYIDQDDEITGIIDKVRSSNYKIVALVLPKRAAVLQSIVNMKLLKRTADASKKNIVLITNEPGLMPLAGAVGVHVAKTLQTKPAIPKAFTDNTDAPLEVSSDDAVDAKLDPSRPIGELAGEETIEVDAPESAVPTVEVKKRSFAKKIKIPNFERFRIGLFLAGFAVIALIVGWYVAFFVMPQAIVTVRTDNSTINTDLTLSGSPTAETPDAEKKIIPSINRELKKTENEKVPATGQKDAGTKASGMVTFVNCSKADKLSDTVLTIPAGTGVSSGNMTFITATAVQVEPSGFTGDTCKSDKPSDEIKVVAQNPGDKYNLSAREYAVAGFSTVTADGEAMTGGTTKVVKVVSQQDIDGAKQKVLDRIGTLATDQLKGDLDGDGYMPLAETITSTQPVVTSAPKIDEEAAEVTVSVAITYTMVGIKSDALKQLMEADITKQIDKNNQVVLDNGLDKATIKASDRKPDGAVTVNVKTIATAGPQLDAEAIKKTIAGKKKGEVQSTIQKLPGVKDVTVEYKPFWVMSTPKKTSKISVVFEKSENAKPAE